MKRYFELGLAMLAGTAIGAAAISGLHAQTKKAYTVSELETINEAAQAVYVPHIQAAQTAAGGRNLNTAGGRTVAGIGTAPKRVAIVEWDSLEKAEAFYKSKAWNDLAAERDKAVKQVRRYAVETVK